MKYLKYLASAILAGIIIGIAATSYLLNPGALGMFLFCFGLFFIMEINLHLYTGKIGFLIEKRNFIEVGITLFGNIIGAVIYSLVVLQTTKGDSLYNASIVKMVGKTDPTASSVFSILILAFFCGAIMYLSFFAKDKSKRENKEVMGYFGIILCIMAFIACGFEHSVANLVYITFAKAWSLNTILIFLLMALGNALGAWFIWGMTKFIDKKED